MLYALLFHSLYEARPGLGRIAEEKEPEGESADGRAEAPSDPIPIRRQCPSQVPSTSKAPTHTCQFCGGYCPDCAN